MYQDFGYEDLIDELKDEVGTGSLSMDETIQILRDKASVREGYHPIVEWYYNDAAMQVELTPSVHDDKEDLAAAKELKQQYEKDLPSLEEITVEACLKELMSHGFSH